MNNYSVYVFERSFPLLPGFVERGCPGGECQDSEGGWDDLDEATWGWKGFQAMCASHCIRQDAHIILVDERAGRIVREMKVTTELPDAWWDGEED